MRRTDSSSILPHLLRECVRVLVRVWVRVRVRVQCVMPTIRAADKQQRSSDGLRVSQTKF